MADIFLSYSHEDEARIKTLVSEFEAQGWSVFWDRRIPVGETWRSWIGSALREARCIVVAWSQFSIESEWVIEEADEGKARKILVPVLLDRVQLPPGFREIQAADISDWHAGQASERLTELIGDLRRILGMRREPGYNEQHLAAPVARVREIEVATRRRSTFGLRGVAVAIALLLSIGVVGYLFFGPPHIKQKAVVSPPNQGHPELSPGSTANSSLSPVGSEGSSTNSGTPERKGDAVTPTGAWFIVAGSFGHADRQSAENQRIALARAGFDAAMIDSSAYPLLKPNLWVVAIGPFESRDAANAALPRLKGTVADAYVKRGR